jgi:hypothetical protein
MRTPVGVTRDGDAVAFVVKPCSARRIGTARIYRNAEASGSTVWRARVLPDAAARREVPVRDAVPGYRVTTGARIAHTWPRFVPTSTRIVTATIEDRRGVWLDDVTFAPADARRGRVFSEGASVSRRTWDTDLDACDPPIPSLLLRTLGLGFIAFSVVTAIAVAHTIVLRRRKRAAV